MTFEIITLTSDGSGYAKVTRDNGVTFGQRFHGLPVGNLADFTDALSSVCEVSEARQLAHTALVGDVLHPDVVALKTGQTVVTVDKNRVKK